LNTRYWLVRKTVCLVAYYGGLRTNEVRSIEFGKTFSGGEKSFEQDESGFWFTFERSKQRGVTETTTICVPRRQSDWVPVVSDSFRSPVDYDPASIIDEYLEVLESDYQKSHEELTGPFFRSTHGVEGRKFVHLPLGINMLAKVGVEFATQLLLPDALGQGFSTFWYSRTPKSKLYPSAYPHPLRVPPNKKFYPNKLHLGKFFEFCVPLWALRVPPVASSCTPRGMRTPG
jgi:hypothetical protein